MKRTVALFLSLCLSMSAFAQSIDMEAGLRSGCSSGLSLRVHTGSSDWVEGMLLSRNQGIQLVVLKGKNNPYVIGRNIPLTMQTAFGGHIGNVRSDYHTGELYFDRRWLPVAGVDFFLAATYQFARFPVSLSLDYKPFAELDPDRFLRVNLWDFGFSIRYQFTSKK